MASLPLALLLGPGLRVSASPVRLSVAHVICCPPLPHEGQLAPTSTISEPRGPAIPHLIDLSMIVVPLKKFALSVKDKQLLREASSESQIV